VLLIGNFTIGSDDENDLYEFSIDKEYQSEDDEIFDLINQ
jgi:hypothetical protein